MTIEAAADRAQLGGTTISGGDWISIDGDSGRVYQGRHEIRVTRPEAELAEIAQWRAKHHAHGNGKPKPAHKQGAEMRLT
jgi:pyruvate,orthophosphate dikinase